MSIATAPIEIRMTKDFETHFCKNLQQGKGSDQRFGDHIDIQLIDVYGSYRQQFISTCFDLVSDLVEEYNIGYWHVAELNHGDGFFILPVDRAQDLFCITAKVANSKAARQYNLDAHTLGLLSTLLAFNKCGQDAQEAQKQADYVASVGGEATHHDACAVKVFHAKKVEVLNMLVHTTEEVAGTATEADAIANIALRDFILAMTE